MTFAVDHLSFILPCILLTQTYRVYIYIGVIGIMEKEMETVKLILGVYFGNFKVILGLDWDNGKNMECSSLYKY